MLDKVAAAWRQAQEGRLEGARVALSRLAERHPRSAEVQATLGDVLGMLRRHEHALHHYRAALEVVPGDPPLLVRLGTALNETGGFREAADALAAAVDAGCDEVEAHNNLAYALLALRRPAEAARRCEAGLRSHPDHPQLILKRCSALGEIGRGNEAVATLEDAVSRRPDDVALAQALATRLNYVDSAGPEQVFRAHLEFGRRLEAACGRAGLTPRKGSDVGPAADRSGRALRVGIVSPDLRRHSVAYFLAPVIRALHARDDFEVIGYETGGHSDEHTARLRAMMNGWREASRLPPRELSDLIRRDRIDIVLETAGLTQGDRLAALSAKPAPVIVTCIGYPNTTGVRAVVARVVDSVTDPPDEADRLATERLIRLDPCFLCYEPPPDAPDPAPGPSVRGEGPVFGSFNALSKVTDSVIRRWASLLREVEGSRLLMKAGALGEEEVRVAVAQRFEAQGVPRERLTLMGWAPGLGRHLEQYREVDVALDTFPYNGTTTTCEALWMGVPVVSLEGASHAGRVGASLLGAIGASDLVARSEGDYVLAAASLAADRDRLDGLRRGLRARAQGSPLCDSPAYGARFAEALVGLWRSTPGR